MGPRAIITLLCGVGLYASLFMLRKTQSARRGELTEASVVQSPRARLFGGISNALIGTVYYPCMIAAAWLSIAVPPLRWVSLGAALLAAVTSAILAWSLLFVTKSPCRYCWTSHAINWLLLPLTLIIVR